jgi:hypothetical protein
VRIARVQNRLAAFPLCLIHYRCKKYEMKTPLSVTKHR